MSHGLPALAEWTGLAPAEQQQYVAALSDDGQALLAGHFAGIAVEQAPLALSVALARLTAALVVAYRYRGDRQVVADAHAIVREAMVELWRLIDGEA